MAHSNNSIIVGKLNGTLGKELVFRDWDGKTIVAKYPKRKKTDPTLPQAALRERFLLGTRYAKAILKDPDPGMKEAYAAVVKPRQNVYTRALEDFMTPPVVSNINLRNYNGAVGDMIPVRASDDFRVVSVLVEIYAPDGTLLEAGEAQPDGRALDWVYTAGQPNPLTAGSRIKAIAIDVPGNEGTLEITL